MRNCFPDRRNDRPWQVCQLRLEAEHLKTVRERPGFVWIGLKHVPTVYIPAQLSIKCEMTWKPTCYIDSEIRRWMKAKGWEVTSIDYHFDQETYAWRHELRGGKSPTLHVHRHVLEHNPAFVVLYHLDRLKVARAIKAKPTARLVVLQKGAEIVLEQVPSE